MTVRRGRAYVRQKPTETVRPPPNTSHLTFAPTVLHTQYVPDTVLVWKLQLVRRHQKGTSAQLVGISYLASGATSLPSTTGPYWRSMIA